MFTQRLERFTATTLFLCSLGLSTGCGTTGRVSAKVSKEEGICVDWDLAGKPIARLSNGTDEAACFCVYPQDGEGDSTGPPQHAMLPPGGEVNLALPGGSLRYVAELVDCDEEEPCDRIEDDEGASLGPFAGSSPRHTAEKAARYWEVFSHDGEFVSYDISVAGFRHSARMERLREVLAYGPLAEDVQVTELQRARLVYDDDGRVLGLEVTVVQDEPVSELGLGINGVRELIDDAFLLGGYWFYIFEVPGESLDLPAGSEVENVFRFRHRSVGDGLVESHLTVTLRP